MKREKADGENHFTEMKPGRRTHIHVEIGVMNIMKSPEERQHVVCPVPPPVGVIHQEKRRDHARPARGGNPIEQADMLGARPAGNRYRKRQRGPAQDRV